MLIRPLRALVLEDHLFQRTIAINMLRQLGCQEVFSASNGAQALEILLKEGAVDIALCDLCMEGMNGLEFMQWAASGGLIKSVIINSSLTEDVRRAARQLVPLLGLTLLGELRKPLQIDALEVLLDKHLGEFACAGAVSLPAAELFNVDEVRTAIDQQQIAPYFQPKINLVTKEVYGVEVLARWFHPVRGVLSPAVFMPSIEHGNLLDQLFLAQLEQSLRLQRLAWDCGYFLNIALNLEASQLSSRMLVSTIKQMLVGHGLPASGLTLELTEGGLLQTPAMSMENLVRLRMMGCGLSIDDFGTGFSSLQRLSLLPFTEIKLDGGFIQNLEGEPHCQAIVSSTLALGRALNMSVVVEGIETAEQYRRLLALGCLQGQGYLFAKPMPRGDLLVWLEAQASVRNSSN